MATTKQVGFHVVQLKHNGVHRGYTIYFNNQPFLKPPRRAKTMLKRPQAYAIARLLNLELKHDRKWAAKFSDPYA